MIRMSGKIVGIISGSSAALIGGTTVTANVLLKDETGQIVINNPLNRDKSFHHYSIANKIMENEKLNDIISISKLDGNITYVIEEKKFISIMKSIMKDTLKSISTFSRDYLNYVIDCNYKLNTKSVLVDLVWYQPEAKNKFFDQFEIILETT